MSMKSRIAAIGIFGALVFNAGSARAAIDDTQAANLMKTGGCRACHSVDKKIVGPAYKDVALKHKGQADAVEVLTKAVRKGSKGVYGAAGLMPPTDAARISDADLHDLLEWVLTK
jgi:cytochrome c